MARKKGTKANNDMSNEIASVEKPKRQTVAALKKEMESLKETNIKLLNDIGALSALYMNTLTENEKASKNAAGNEKETIILATKRILGILMQTYGFTIADIVK